EREREGVNEYRTPTRTLMEVVVGVGDATIEGDDNDDNDVLLFGTATAAVEPVAGNVVAVAVGVADAPALPLPDGLTATPDFFSAFASGNGTVAKMQVRREGRRKENDGGRRRKE